jgi:hypothetical protein
MGVVATNERVLGGRSTVARSETHYRGVEADVGDTLGEVLLTDTISGIAWYQGGFSRKSWQCKANIKVPCSIER